MHLEIWKKCPERSLKPSECESREDSLGWGGEDKHKLAKSEEESGGRTSLPEVVSPLLTPGGLVGSLQGLPPNRSPSE